MTAPFGNFFGHFDDFLKVARDENFKKFLANPKVQQLMNDAAFKKAVEEKNMFKLMAHQEFTALMRDPEVRETLTVLSRNLKKPDEVLSGGL